MLRHWLPSLKETQSTFSQYEVVLETYLFLRPIVKYVPVVLPSSYTDQIITKI